MRMISRLTIAAGLAIASAAAFAGNAHHVTVYNDTPNLITSVAVSSPNGWIPVALHQHDNTLPTGAQERVAIPEKAGCRVALRVTLDNGTALVQPIFNACTAKRFDLVPAKS